MIINSGKLQIIQYWSDSHLPKNIKDLTNSWKRMNKNFNHHVFNKEEASNFIKNNFDIKVYEAFMAIKLPAMEADVFRVAYVLINGGLYVDCATECLRPIDNILEFNSKLILVRKLNERIWNGFIFAAEPHNNVLQKIWDIIKNNILTRTEGNIASLTGPILFKINKYVNVQNSIVLDEENIKDIFILIRSKMHHRGHNHWSMMQAIEPLYIDSFKYKPKVNDVKKLQLKHIIVHIGQHATEAKSLQDFLSFIEKPDDLFLYPKVGREISNHDLMCEILSSCNEKRIDDFFKEFYIEASQSENKIIIISSEFFSSFSLLKFNKLKMTRLWERLNQLIAPFHQRKIVYYIREQAESIQCRLDEAIRGSECLETVNINQIINCPMLDYTLFNNVLNNYFPDVNICPKIYNAELLTCKKIYIDLFGDVLPLPQDIIWALHEKRDEPMQSAILIKILLFINNMNLGINKKVQLKNIFIERVPNKGNFTFFTDSDIHKIRNKFILSNKVKHIEFFKKVLSVNNSVEDLSRINDLELKHLIVNYFPDFKYENVKTLNKLINILYEGKKMKKIFLHIGAGKTGTSALQSHFVLNKQYLEKNNYYYPTAKNEFKAKELKITAGNGIELAQLLMQKDCNTESIEALGLQYIKDADGKDIIISSEILTLFRPACAKVFKDTVIRLGYEIIVIYYVRAIADHLLSSYHQQLKRHTYSKKFTVFIQNRKNDFLETISKSIDVFGRENLIVKNYDVVKGEIFLDFIENILEIDDVQNLIVKNKKINRSLTEFEVALMRYMNISFSSTKDSTFISDALIYGDPNAKYKMSISDKDLEIVSKKYNEDIDKINEYLYERERPLSLISGLEIKEDNDISLNHFQKATLSILAELTKKI